MVKASKQQEARHRLNGALLELSRRSACALCGVRCGGRGSAVRTETAEVDLGLESMPPSQAGWLEVGRRTVAVDPKPGGPLVQAEIVSLERRWRLCPRCRFAHELDGDADALEWPLMAALAVLGHVASGPPFDAEQVEDAVAVVAELGSFAYRHHGQPHDDGHPKPWGHVSAETIERAGGIVAERAQERSVTAEYGTRSRSGDPCWICGCTRSKEWGEPPPPDWGQPPRPAELAVCKICADAWATARESRSSDLLDWAAGQAAGGPVERGIGRRVGFVLAHRHPAFREVGDGEARAAWAYLGDDAGRLRAYVHGAASAPNPDGKLRIPAVPT
jgi:hypothetical protein